MAGSPTITEDLHDDPKFKTVHRSRVATLMNKMGLCCKIQRKFTVTTDSRHDEWIADNLLDRDFSPEEPHSAVAGDITYIRVASHWMYLSVFIDLYSRKIVGWDLSESLSADSTCRAFRKYLNTIGYIDGLMVHSDRGIQYASEQFRNILKSIKAIQSMSRKGNCWDNAVSESFFHTLKTRLIYHRKYQTKKELERDLFWYIEIYYNRVRKHSANEWMTPEQKECNFYNIKIAA
jgi:putative transposase